MSEHELEYRTPAEMRELEAKAAVADGLFSSINYLVEELQSTPELNLSSWGIGLSEVLANLDKYNAINGGRS